MASFQAKIGWKMLRKREYKKYRSVSFLPDAKQKIQKKIAKKIQKFKKYHFGFNSGKIRLEKDAKERKQKTKIIITFRFNPTRNRKFQKHIKKIKKYRYVFFSSQNGLEKDRKGRK